MRALQEYEKLCTFRKKAKYVDIFRSGYPLLHSYTVQMYPYFRDLKTKDCLDSVCVEFSLCSILVSVTFFCGRVKISDAF